jgi:hypothetical protein
MTDRTEHRPYPAFGAPKPGDLRLEEPTGVTLLAGRSGPSLQTRVRIQKNGLRPRSCDYVKNSSNERDDCSGYRKTKDCLPPFDIVLLRKDIHRLIVPISLLVIPEQCLSGQSNGGPLG